MGGYCMGGYHMGGFYIGGFYIGGLILTVSAAQVVYTIHCRGRYCGCVADI